MAKQKILKKKSNLEEDLKKLKIPKQEAKKEKIEPKKEELKKEEIKEEPEEDFQQTSNFSESILSKSIGFAAPVIQSSQQAPEPLETTASQVIAPSNNAGVNITYSNRNDFDRGYSAASDYQGNQIKKYDRDETRAIPVISSERREAIVNTFASSSGRERLAGSMAMQEKSQLQEFLKNQEQIRQDAAEASKLPFQQKRRKREIF